jgi:tRNA dimethylallyltransferase
MSKIPVLCIPGPTGAGKSSAACRIASELGGVIINCDSRQLYRDFPIITAQPDAAELARAPHKLYGILEIEDALGAAKYAEAARKEIKDALQQGLLPMLVGGTGFYLKALFDPLAPIPDIPENIRREIYERCEKEGSQVLHAELQGIDPESAARIHPNDKQRTARALEVWKATGRSLSSWHQETICPNEFNVLKLGITQPLDELKSRLAERIKLMLEAGAVDEAKAAYAKCSDPDAPGWSGIGCAELYSYIIGDIDLEESSSLWLKNTRAYAKRQMTWFRADRSIQWFAPEQEDGVFAEAEKFYRESRSLF